MKKFLLILTLFISCTIFAQKWQTDFKTAKKLATEQKRPIILVFQGSDWCAPCMKLENEIWSSTDFKEYASKNYVLLKADFPRRRKNKLSKELQKHNDNLAEKYNKKGIFPLVIRLDNTGKVLKQMGYEKISPKAYIAKLNQ